ncbi:MAG: LysR family transcriptional regulator [Sarcina sp.]
MLNFKDLEYFKSLSETKSFTKTAQDFYVSQPSISNAIRNLEDYFKVKLINREKFEKSISVTSYGIELLKVIDQIDGALNIFEEKIKKQLKEHVEMVIGIPPIVDNAILKDLLFKIFNINNFGKTEIILEEHYMIDLHKKLQDESIDLIIGYYLGKKNYVHNIKSIFLTSLKINFYEKKKDSGIEKPFTPKDLNDVTIVSLIKPSVHSRLIEKVLTEFDIQPKEIIYVKDFNICETLIENGSAVSIFGEGSCSGNTNISSKPIDSLITIDLFLEYNYLKSFNNINSEFLEKIIISTYE